MNRLFRSLGSTISTINPFSTQPAPIYSRRPVAPLSNQPWPGDPEVVKPALPPSVPFSASRALPVAETKSTPRALRGPETKSTSRALSNSESKTAKGRANPKGDISLESAPGSKPMNIDRVDSYPKHAALSEAVATQMKKSRKKSKKKLERESPIHPRATTQTMTSSPDLVTSKTGRIPSDMFSLNTKDQYQHAQSTTFDTIPPSSFSHVSAGHRNPFEESQTNFYGHSSDPVPSQTVRPIPPPSVFSFEVKDGVYEFHSPDWRKRPIAWNSITSQARRPDQLPNDNLRQPCQRKPAQQRTAPTDPKPADFQNWCHRYPAALPRSRVSKQGTGQAYVVEYSCNPFDSPSERQQAKPAMAPANVPGPSTQTELFESNEGRGDCDTKHHTEPTAPITEPTEPMTETDETVPDELSELSEDGCIWDQQSEVSEPKLEPRHEWIVPIDEAQVYNEVKLPEGAPPAGAPIFPEDFF
eukprot:GHVO01046420.1.p1 GENE.GHVO01046420.1~~GHVO01046420.1.p1  ORF type:complete len:484 (-),score=26.54 GHVO01046420.1:228-1640(-)